MSKDRCAQALFLASNAAYLLAGSFLTLGAQAELGVLTLCVCGASLLESAEGGPELNAVSPPLPSAALPADILIEPT